MDDKTFGELLESAHFWARLHIISAHDEDLVARAAKDAYPLLTNVEVLLHLSLEERKLLIETLFFVPGRLDVIFTLPHGWMQIARAARLPEKFVAKQIYLRAKMIRSREAACVEGDFLTELAKQPDLDDDGYMRFMTEEQAETVAYKLWFLRRSLIAVRFGGNPELLWPYARRVRRLEP